MRIPRFGVPKGRSIEGADSVSYGVAGLSCEETIRSPDRHHTSEDAKESLCAYAHSQFLAAIIANSAKINAFAASPIPRFSLFLALRSCSARSAYAVKESIIKMSLQDFALLLSSSIACCLPSYSPVW